MRALRRIASRAKPAGARLISSVFPRYYLLLRTGDYLLLKKGGRLILKNPPAVPAYEAETIALLSRFTTQPTPSTRADRINDLIVALKTAGVWSKLDALYVMAAHDAQAAQRNWIADQYNLTAVSSPTFTADRGYTGNGTSSYLGTGFVPTTAGGLYALNDAHVSVWSRTSTQTNTVEIGARDASGNNQVFLQVRAATNRTVSRINQDVAFGDAAATDGSGHFLLTRRGATESELYRNGVSSLDSASASDAMPGREILLGALNTAGVAGLFSPKQLAGASIGGGISDAEALAFHAALNTYLTAVGAA